MVISLDSTCMCIHDLQFYEIVLLLESLGMEDGQFQTMSTYVRTFVA
jgi:hypothetical protein